MNEYEITPLATYRHHTRAVNAIVLDTRNAKVTYMLEYPGEDYTGPFTVAPWLFAELFPTKL